MAEMKGINFDLVTIIAIGFILASGFVVFGIASNPERPDLPLGLAIEPLSPEPGEITETVTEAIGRGQDKVDSIVWFSGLWAPPNAAAFAKDSASLLSFTAPMLAFGADIYAVMPTFGAAAMTIPVENLGSIANLPSVDFIDEDKTFFIDAFQNLDIDQVATTLDFSRFWDNGWTGENIDIYYLDTGGVDGIGLASIESAFVDSSGRDVAGHGSAVGYLLKNLAPDARVHSIKVLDDHGQGQISIVMAGLEQAIQSEQDPEVINLSLSIPTEIFDSLSRACEKLHFSYNVDIFAAAGNTGAAEGSPSKSISVVGVGSVNDSLELTSYSARTFDIVAPGDTVSLWQGSLRNISGTSFSSPIAAALWANYLSQNPDAVGRSTDEISTLMQGSQITAQGHSMPTGSVLSETEPVPRPPAIVTAAPWIALAVGLAAVGIGILIYKRRQ